MVQKLVAVALVFMVTSADGLQNCFGINLGMAAACAMVQAYARPQVRLYPNQVVCCKRIHECRFVLFPFVLSLAATSPLSGSPNFGVRSFACSLYSLFESCKCLVFDAGKVVNVTVIANSEDHQVNLLQSFCFLCLALATLSFHYGWVWSSRAAFALPFMVTAVQGLTPDSAETLALRIWQVTDEFGWKFGEWLDSSSP